MYKLYKKFSARSIRGGERGWSLKIQILGQQGDASWTCNGSLHPFQLFLLLCRIKFRSEEGRGGEKKKHGRGSWIRNEVSVACTRGKVWGKRRGRRVVSRDRCLQASVSGIAEGDVECQIFRLSSFLFLCPWYSSYFLFSLYMSLSQMRLFVSIVITIDHN